MIRVCSLTAELWPKVEAYLTGNKKKVNPAVDVVTVAVDDKGDVVGVIVGEQVMLMHEFVVDPGTNAHHVAELLWAYSMGAGKCAGYTQGLLIVDKTNERMLRFVAGQHAQEYANPDRDSVFLVKVV